MSEKTQADWQNIPDLVFSDIAVMVGQESLEELQKCRQVCQCWNVMISRMTKLRKDTLRRKAEGLASRIKGGWEEDYDHIFYFYFHLLYLFNIFIYLFLFYLFSFIIIYFLLIILYLLFLFIINH